MIVPSTLQHFRAFLWPKCGGEAQPLPVCQAHKPGLGSRMDREGQGHGKAACGGGKGGSRGTKFQTSMSTPRPGEHDQGVRWVQELNVKEK